MPRWSVTEIKFTSLKGTDYETADRVDRQLEIIAAAPRSPGVLQPLEYKLLRRLSKWNDNFLPNARQIAQLPQPLQQSIAKAAGTLGENAMSKPQISMLNTLKAFSRDNYPPDLRVTWQLVHKKSGKVLHSDDYKWRIDTVEIQAFAAEASKRVAKVRTDGGLKEAQGLKRDLYATMRGRYSGGSDVLGYFLFPERSQKSYGDKKVLTTSVLDVSTGEPSTSFERSMAELRGAYSALGVLIEELKQTERDAKQQRLNDQRDLLIKTSQSSLNLDGKHIQRSL